MAPKLYGFNLSPGVRAVWLTAKVLNVELENINIDITKGEQLSPEFLKINPQHIIPTLDDNGVIVWDSHAILIYLAEKYGESSTLYPNDLAKRAAVNRLLFFEAGDIFAAHLQICISVLGGSKDLPERPLECLKKSFGFLETFLQNSKYVAGDDLTIADFSIWTTISNAQNWIPLDKEEYPNIVAWKNLMDSLPYADINLKNAELFKEKVNKMRS